MVTNTTMTSWREHFLNSMFEAVDWARLEALIEPYYAEFRDGPPFPLSVMLRIYFIQYWFDYRDEETIQSLHNQLVLRCFAGLGVHPDAPVPDEGMLAGFRDMLERIGLRDVVFDYGPGLSPSKSGSVSG